MKVSARRRVTKLSRLVYNLFQPKLKGEIRYFGTLVGCFLVFIPLILFCIEIS